MPFVYVHQGLSLIKWHACNCTNQTCISSVLLANSLDHEQL